MEWLQQQDGDRCCVDPHVVAECHCFFFFFLGRPSRVVHCRASSVAVVGQVREVAAVTAVVSAAVVAVVVAATAAAVPAADAEALLVVAVVVPVRVVVVVVAMMDAALSGAGECRSG